MPNENTSKPKALILAVISSSVIAALTGAFVGNYFTRQGLRIDAERLAYIEWLKVTREHDLDLRRDPDVYVEMTAVPIRKLAIHAGEPVLTDLVKEWRLIKKAIVPCCGDLEQIKASVSMVQNMRKEVKPVPLNPLLWFSDDISDHDMMFLLNICDLPETVDKQVPCQ